MKTLLSAVLITAGVSLGAPLALAEHTVPAWAQTSGPLNPFERDFTTQSTRPPSDYDRGMTRAPVVIPPDHLSATDPYVYPIQGKGNK